MKSNRNLWPLGIFVTFGLFFIGMASVVVIAATHREHLVNNNYYEQELKFQGQMDAVARTQKSGASISGDPAARVVVIAVPAYQLARKFSGKIELYRPSAPELDRELPLEPRADGTQTLDVSKLAAGLWAVRARWTAGGDDYFMEQRITVIGK
jgi:hypothetical protein